MLTKLHPGEEIDRTKKGRGSGMGYNVQHNHKGSDIENISREQDDSLYKIESTDYIGG